MILNGKICIYTNFFNNDLHENFLKPWRFKLHDSRGIKFLKQRFLDDIEYVSKYLLFCPKIQP